MAQGAAAIFIRTAVLERITRHALTDPRLIKNTFKLSTDLQLAVINSLTERSLDHSELREIHGRRKVFR